MREELEIRSYLDSTNAETMEQGDAVYNKIKPLIEEYLNNGSKVVINFSQINSLTTKFLNNAIGNLFLNLDSAKLISNLTFSGLDAAKKTTLKWSLNTALERAKIK